MSTTPLTVRDLVTDPTLSTRVLAGNDGLDAPVLWAHASEIPEPERWLGPHELLMTIGLCVPTGSLAQQQFITRLADAGLAGLAIGEDGLAPRLTKALIAEADARGFPVLSTGGDVPFALLGRTVAAANADAQTMGVLQLARLYHAVGRQDPAGRRSGVYLRDMFGTNLAVVDDATSCVVIGSGAVRTDATRSFGLRSARPTRILVDGELAANSLTMAHLTQVLAVEATAILQAAEDRSRSSTRRFEGVLAGHEDATREALRVLASDATHPVGEVQVIAVPLTVPGRFELAVALSDLPVIGVTTRADAVITALSPEHVPALRALIEELGLVAGVSARHLRVDDLPAALEEAVSELARARSDDQPWREYRGEPLSLLTRSDSEARRVIEVVLGPLAARDHRCASLRSTLFALLDQDMRWGATAEALGIHRQTLVHRMQRVEELTGKSVRSTQQLAEFWLARTAWQRVHPNDESPHGRPPITAAGHVPRRGLQTPAR